VLQQLDDRRLHHVGDSLLGIGHDELGQRQDAEQLLLAVDHEHLVGLRRQLVETAQVAQHHLQRDVGPHLHVVEVHQRADHVVVEGHRGAQLLALLDRQALEDVVDDLLREVVAISAISSASSVSAAATSSSVSIEEMSDSRTASETSTRISPSRSARTRSQMYRRSSSGSASRMYAMSAGCRRPSVRSSSTLIFCVTALLRRATSPPSPAGRRSGPRRAAGAAGAT
jgi:hypothetical protein